MKRPGKVFIPTEIAKPFLLKLIEDRHYLFDDSGKPSGGAKALSNDARISERQLYGVITDEYKGIGFDVFDRIITLTGNYMLWHVPVAEGGFAEYYEDDAPRMEREKNKGVRVRRPGRLCACGKELDGKTRGDECVKCRNERRAREAPRCECGSQLDYRAKQCRPCFNRDRFGSKGESKKWINTTEGIIKKNYHLKPHEKQHYTP